MQATEKVSRRTPEDADEMERIKASSEYEAGNAAAVERYYQVLYVPFFNDRQVALSTQYRLTKNRRRTATPHSGSSPTSASTHCP